MRCSRRHSISSARAPKKQAMKQAADTQNRNPAKSSQTASHVTLVCAVAAEPFF
jgi:hypothetical protein